MDFLRPFVTVIYQGLCSMCLRRERVYGSSKCLICLKVLFGRIPVRIAEAQIELFKKALETAPEKRV